MLDFEVPVAGPGKKRTLDKEEGGSIETEGQSIDLKVSITEREKQGVKQDPYFSYKICTDVSTYRCTLSKQCVCMYIVIINMLYSRLQ